MGGDTERQILLWKVWSPVGVRGVGVVCAAGTNGDNGDAFVAAAAGGWCMVDVLLLLM